MWAKPLTKAKNHEQIDVNKPVAVHYVNHKHQTLELRGMTIEHLEHVQQPIRGGDCDRLLLQCEAFWICTFGMV